MQQSVFMIISITESLTCAVLQSVDSVDGKICHQKESYYGRLCHRYLNNLITISNLDGILCAVGANLLHYFPLLQCSSVCIYCTVTIWRTAIWSWVYAAEQTHRTVPSSHAPVWALSNDYTFRWKFFSLACCPICLVQARHQHLPIPTVMFARHRQVESKLQLLRRWSTCRPVTFCSGSKWWSGKNNFL